MTAPHPLDVRYEDHGCVRELVDVVRYCIEDVSLSFDRWDEPQVRGPGLYVAVVAGRSLRDYADAMGDNRWPTSECRTVMDDITAFCETAREVGTTRDGAVVVSVDGVIQEQMVRFRDYQSAGPDGTEIRYADWMGSRHMSAADTSARPDVVTTLTLSAENGRVTLFADGDYETYGRSELSEGWRSPAGVE